MSFTDILISIITGIISGILSSLIITVIYRKIDQEKDRQNYFHDLRAYIYLLFSHSFSDTEKLKDFFLVNEFPCPYKWIHLTKQEKDLIHEVEQYCESLRDLILMYHTEKEESKFTKQPFDQNKYSTKRSKIQFYLTYKYESIMNLGKKGNESSTSLPFTPPIFMHRM